MATVIIAADALQGRPVVDGEGRPVGVVEDIAIDLEAGRIAYALLSRDGIDEELLPIPWEALHPREDREGFVMEPVA